MNDQQKAIAIALYREGKGPQFIANFLGIDNVLVSNFFQFNIKNSKDFSLEGRRSGLDGALPSSITNTTVKANILGVVTAVVGVGTLALVTIQPIKGSTNDPLGKTFVAQANDAYSTYPSDPTKPAVDAAGRSFGVNSKVIADGVVTAQSGNVFTITLMTSGFSIIATNGSITLNP